MRMHFEAGTVNATFGKWQTAQLSYRGAALSRAGIIGLFVCLPNTLPKPADNRLGELNLFAVFLETGKPRVDEFVAK